MNVRRPVALQSGSFILNRGPVRNRDVASEDGYWLSGMITCACYEAIRASMRTLLRVVFGEEGAGREDVDLWFFGEIEIVATWSDRVVASFSRMCQRLNLRKEFNETWRGFTQSFQRGVAARRRSISDSDREGLDN